MARSISYIFYYQEKLRKKKKKLTEHKTTSNKCTLNPYLFTLSTSNKLLKFIQYLGTGTSSFSGCACGCGSGC